MVKMDFDASLYLFLIYCNFVSKWHWKVGIVAKVE